MNDLDRKHARHLNATTYVTLHTLLQTLKFLIFRTNYLSVLLYKLALGQRALKAETHNLAVPRTIEEKLSSKGQSFEQGMERGEGSCSETHNPQRSKSKMMMTRNFSQLLKQTLKYVVQLQQHSQMLTTSEKEDCYQGNNNALRLYIKTIVPSHCCFI